MYLGEGAVYTVITPDGKTTAYDISDYNTDIYDTEFYASAGDGYVVTWEHKSGSFDTAAEFIYHIYDGTGNELSSFSSGSSLAYASGVRHMGEGTFYFQSENYYGETHGDLYFAKSNTWLRNVSNVSTYLDGILMYSASDSSSKQFTYANSMGESQTITAPAEYGEGPSCIRHVGGMILFVDNETSYNLQKIYSTRAVYYYDTGTGNWSSYQGQYTDKVYYSNKDYRPVVGDGHIAICLKGADGAYYTMLLDRNMADVLDAPIPGIPVSILDGVLYIKDSSDSSKRILYDFDGKLLAEISDVKYITEGIIVTAQGEFLKPDGTPAFSEIDFSTGRLITLP